MVDEKDVDGLAKMYNLFGRVDGLKLLRDSFQAHVNVRICFHFHCPFASSLLIRW